MSITPTDPASGAEFGPGVRRGVRPGHPPHRGHVRWGRRPSRHRARRPASVSLINALMSAVHAAKAAA